MKNIILYASALMLIACGGTMAQVATNKVVNTATIFATNSPVTFNGGMTATNAIFSGTTTNTGAFVSGSVNSTNYMVNGVRGMTLSVTNVGIGETNVEVFAEGLLTNKFILP